VGGFLLRFRFTVVWLVDCEELCRSVADVGGGKGGGGEV
jgi:hypothetical protein